VRKAPAGAARLAENGSSLSLRLAPAYAIVVSTRVYVVSVYAAATIRMCAPAASTRAATVAGALPQLCPSLRDSP